MRLKIASIWLAGIFLTLLLYQAIGQLAPTNKLPRVIATWDPNKEPDIAGYKIYHGTNSRLYTVVLDAGNKTNLLMSNFVRGVTYYFAATAINQSGLESDFSVEVSLTIPLPPVSPTNINVVNPDK